MLHTKFPDGKKLDQQLSLELANKQGIWNEECNSGKCDAMIALQEGAFFNLPGKYTLTIEQFMRYEPVLGVEKIGLLIENTGVDRKSFLNSRSDSKKKNLKKK